MLTTIAVCFCRVRFTKPPFQRQNVAKQQAPRSQGPSRQHSKAKGQRALRVPTLTLLIFGGLVLGKINRYLHSMIGNISSAPWNVTNPYAGLGHQPLHLPNGMVVFWVSWREKSFTIWYSRRQRYEQMVSSPTESPLLYRNLVKAITANSGEPGSRHLISMDLQKRWKWHRALQSGHEDRTAFGGNTGFRHRSEAARGRRKEAKRAQRAQSRKDYRAWKSQQGEPSGWAGQRVAAPPPLLPTHSTVSRSRKHRLPSQPSYRASRATWFRTYVQRHHQGFNIPKQIRFSHPIKIATWNVEGLYELTKYDQIMAYMKKEHIAVLAMQETKSTQTCSFIKNGFEFFFSGQADSKYHGVGFVVSPQTRHMVTNFLGFNSRCCSLDLNVAPSPVQLVCVYAPSMVADPQEDVDRKEEFWNFMGSTFNNLPKHKQICFLGDWNARISVEQDPAETAVGPDAWSKRQAVTNPERDNAVFFCEFLLGHNLFLPQTFNQPSLKHRITYKETTAGLSNIYRPELCDWAALDYVAVPIKSARQVIQCRSNPFVSLSSRHFPVELTITIIPSAKAEIPSTSPKLDFTTGHGNYRGHLDHVLLEEIDCEPIKPDQGSYKRAIFTAGSCSRDCIAQAGWGFTVSKPVAVDGDSLMVTTFDVNAFGPVELPVGSLANTSAKNLAEIQAVIEVLDWLLGFCQDEGCQFVLFLNSDYVLGFLEGRNHPKTNFYQVSTLLQYWYAATAFFQLTACKVPARRDIPGNKWADVLAFNGRTDLGKEGRFAVSPPSPLIAPEYAVTTPCPKWESSSLDHQNEILTNAVLNAAKLSFAPIPPNKRKPYLSPETFSLVQQLAHLTAPEQEEERRGLRNRIKTCARRDKKKWWAENFQLDAQGPPATQWKTIRSSRSSFTAKPTNICDLRGVLRPRHQRADVFAEYLSQVVWSSKMLPPFGDPNYSFSASMAAQSPIFLQELLTALAKLKLGKTPGPDRVHPEMLKFSSPLFQSLLLSLLTGCFLGGAVPHAWKQSNVVLLLKNSLKSSSALTNYRPISLSSCFYKIYASILRERLRPFVDPFLRGTQYGFRPARSTSQPIHILRQLLQAHERQLVPLHLVFLDWSKAFDSITHEALAHSLAYHSVPEQLIVAIMSLYDSPTFRVMDWGEFSSPRSQESGLRQGCPLSPFLFILSTTCMFNYVEAEHEMRFGLIPSVFPTTPPSWDLQFADDMVLMANSAQLANRLLHGVQRHGFRFGLELNADKCEHIAVNSEETVHMRTGDKLHLCNCKHCGGVGQGNPITKVTGNTYLGVPLNMDGSPETYVASRLRKANAAVKALGNFWQASFLSAHFRLRVYQAVIQNILLYSIESVVPTPAQNQRLDALHFKILRQIFRVKAPFYHRVLVPSDSPCSNSHLQLLANSHGLRIYAPSQVAAVRRLKLLGHLLRHESDPSHLVSFMPSHSYRFLRGENLRVGRPRPHWAELTLTEAYRRTQLLLENNVPTIVDLTHPFFSIPTAAEIYMSHGHTVKDWRNNARFYRAVRDMALDKTKWRAITGQHLKDLPSADFPPNYPMDNTT